ncbi:expressed unknown protein [Seminavis robusta]|uniref:Uncharacterized protein n=1 Tax=Seminavis robusta TaxID=568900 RepID=A0A9N8DVL4_9STRA|nr:expressed unknown protein [Seminavis robusta]|eukprot:Sro405_g136220.1 n/a (265) ;mRNA; f:54668-55462
MKPLVNVAITQILLVLSTITGSIVKIRAFHVPTKLNNPPLHVQSKTFANQPRFSPSIVSSSTTRLHAIPTATASTMSQILLRGGAAVALDMSREGYKLQSMATYSTITALIMNACLRLYTSQKFSSKHNNKNTRWTENAFIALTTTCIICGAFTAVLFNILGIYSKESLGMRNDAGYLAFQTATAVYRKWGFRTFLVTCWCFVGSFLLTVYEKSIQECQTTLGRVVLVASVIMALVAGFRIHEILVLATKLIYTPAACKLNHIA